MDFYGSHNDNLLSLDKYLFHKTQTYCYMKNIKMQTKVRATPPMAFALTNLDEIQQWNGLRCHFYSNFAQGIDTYKTSIKWK